MTHFDDIERTASDRVASTVSSTPCNVLIVGGGPAGLAAALMLAKRGWTDITVLEKRAAIDDYEPDKSFNYLIDGRGQKLTDLLGLTQPLADIGVASTAFYITRIQPNGSRKTSKLPFVDPNRKPAYWLPRSAFMRLLYQDVRYHWQDHITVLFQAQCERINQIVKNGIAQLEVVVTRKNGCECIQPQLLIGCDGVQSSVRSALNEWDHDCSGRFEMQRLPSPSAGLRYKVLSLPPHFPLDPHGQERAEAEMSYTIRGAFHDRERFLSLGLLPLKDPEAPRTANLITRSQHHLWKLKTGEQLLTFLEHSFPQLPLRQIVSIEEADRVAHSEGGAFPMPQYCSGLQVVLNQGVAAKGILLLGDAIHCFPPDIGQGVNAALEDVCVLHEALLQGHDQISASLPLYESLRAPDVKAVVRLAQTAAPWQYNQAPLRRRLWTANFLLRLGVSRLLPVLSPPAFLLLQKHELSYQAIWGKEQQTRQFLSALSLVMLGSALLLTWIVIHASVSSRFLGLLHCHF